VCGQSLAQNATAGQVAFQKCSTCHSIDGSNGVGPSLRGILGREVGSFPGFPYSRALIDAGYSWDLKSLDAYIADPQKALPGTTKPVSGVSDVKQRADLIKYLQTLK